MLQIAQIKIFQDVPVPREGQLPEKFFAIHRRVSIQLRRCWYVLSSSTTTRKSDWPRISLYSVSKLERTLNIVSLLSAVMSTYTTFDISSG